MSKKTIKEQANKKLRLEIEIEKLSLLYKIEKKWPEIWKWIQLQANKGIPLEDVLYTLENYWAQKDQVNSAWAYCTIALQKRMQRTKEKQRKTNWDQVKWKEANFAERLAELIKHIGKSA